MMTERKCNICGKKLGSTYYSQKGVYFCSHECEEKIILIKDSHTHLMFENDDNIYRICSQTNDGSNVHHQILRDDEKLEMGPMGKILNCRYCNKTPELQKIRKNETYYLTSRTQKIKDFYYECSCGMQASGFTKEEAKISWNNMMKEK